jgi:hypothetical protein
MVAHVTDPLTDTDFQVARARIGARAQISNESHNGSAASALKS